MWLIVHLAYQIELLVNFLQPYVALAFEPLAPTVALIWQQHDAIAGFNEPQSLPANLRESVSVDVEVLPPNKNTNKTQSVRKSKPATKPPRKIQLIDDDDFLNETDDLEAELDDDDFEEDEEIDDEDE